MRTHALILMLLLVVQSVGPTPTKATFDGNWLWKGPGGWQRITLELKTAGSRLTGTLMMGPGSVRAPSKESDWEHFFEPAAFPVLRGSTSGTLITFEQDLQILAPSQPTTNIVPAISGTERLRYTGTLDGDRLVLVRESTARPKDPFAIGRHKMTFTMTRTGEVEVAPKGDAARVGTFVPARRRFFVDVAVTDSSGRPVDGLSLEDFILKEDNQPRPVSRIELPSAPVNVLLMFDHNLTWLQSGGQNSDRLVLDAWSALLGSAMNFLNSLRPVDRVAAATFEDNVGFALRWRSASGGGQTASLGDVVRSPNGQKNLYDAITWTKDQFAGASGRKVAIFFTDGRDGRLAPRWLRDPEGREVLDPPCGLEDDGERAEFESVLAAASQSRIRFYFIAVNTTRDPEFGPAIIGRRISGLYPGADEGIAGSVSRVRARMAALAEATGGKVFLGNTPQDAISLYTRLRSDLGIGTTYTLEFDTATSADGGSRRVDVEVRRDGLRVTQTHYGSYAR